MVRAYAVDLVGRLYDFSFHVSKNALPMAVDLQRNQVKKAIAAKKNKCPKRYTFLDTKPTLQLFYRLVF